MELVKQERQTRNECLRFLAYDNGSVVGSIEHYSGTVGGAWARVFQHVPDGFGVKRIYLGELSAKGVDRRNASGLEMIQAAYLEAQPVNPGLPSDADGLPS
jgi:hypothetical protein